MIPSKLRLIAVRLNTFWSVCSPTGQRRWVRTQRTAGDVWTERWRRTQRIPRSSRTHRTPGKSTSNPCTPSRVPTGYLFTLLGFLWHYCLNQTSVGAAFWSVSEGTFRATLSNSPVSISGSWKGRGCLCLPFSKVPMYTLMHQDVGKAFVFLQGLWAKTKVL